MFWFQVTWFTRQWCGATFRKSGSFYLEKRQSRNTTTLTTNDTAPIFSYQQVTVNIWIPDIWITETSEFLDFLNFGSDHSLFRCTNILLSAGYAIQWRLNSGHPDTGFIWILDTGCPVFKWPSHVTWQTIWKPNILDH